MRFSHKDKKDQRVSRQSTYAFDFPQKLDQAPRQQGVFVLLNEASDVLYVGRAAAGRFGETLSGLVGTAPAGDAIAYRWFVTESEQAADALVQDWIGKYQPVNQAL
jgi:excinuclease UvrABC nuclease subunit